MERPKLKELAADPNFISGIYNYCDRWCERCQFTSRCMLFAQEQDDPDLDDPEVRDINNEKFWKKLAAIFAETSEMITEWAAEAGVDLDAVDAAEELSEHEREVNDAEQHELSVASRKYATSIEEWFKREFVEEAKLYDNTDSESDEANVPIRDAIDVVRWYQFFIAAKTFRALTGLRHVEEAPEEAEDWLGDWSPGADDSDDEDDIDYDAVVAKSSRMDANGSAKIALVGMDRSISAWRALQLALPDKAEPIKPLLIELETLRLRTEQCFPRARDFIRPGFDEQLSEFVS